MRVVLTNFAFGWTEPPVFPLGMAYIAGSLHRHDVVCFDAAVAKNPEDDLRDLVGRHEPEVIGVSLRNIDSLQSYGVVSYWPFFVDSVKRLRELCPGAALVAGGSGFSLFAEAVMRHLPELDYGIHLEGEESFAQLLDNLDQPHNVKGVYYRRSDEVLFSGIREPVDFESLPMPPRDILDLSPYGRLPGMGLQTKRGCAFDCLYCTYPFLTGKRIRLRAPKDVGDEIEMLSRQYGVKEVFISDDVFNWPPRHAEDVCRELIKRNLDVQWTAYFTERGMTSEFLNLALEAGCVKFIFSPDGYNDEGLAFLGKHTNRQQLEATYRLLAETSGAKFRCSFIWNYPNTALRDLRDLIGVASRLVQTKNLLGMDISTMRVLPNTRLHQIAVAEGRIDPDDDLLEPTYYDPFPGSIASTLINTGGRLLKAAKYRTGKTIFRKT